MDIIGFYHSAKYIFKSRPYRLEKPTVLQFPVIDICNSRCQMCRIWENHSSSDITPAQLARGLRNPLYSEVAAVGLNGGEPTLRKDLGELAQVLFDELPKLQTIALITNAYKSDEVIERIGDLVKVVRNSGGSLDVMVSLDGYGDMHDKVRGKPGNFERAKKVIDFLKKSPDVGSTRIGCTVIKENVFGLADLFEFCRREDLYIKYRLGVPHQRLYTQDLKAPYSLSIEEKYHVAEFFEGLIEHYEPGARQKSFYRSLIDQLLYDAPRKAGCDWQHRGATITSKGDLLYCAVQSKVLGSIIAEDSRDIYFRNQDHLDEILRSRCESCHHDYVGIPQRTEYAREIVLRVARRVGQEKRMRRLFQTVRASGHYRNRVFKSRLAAMRSAGSPVGSAVANTNRPRVLICGWYGTETLGDKAILAGICQSLRTAFGSIDFIVASLHPYVCEMTRRQMPELAEIQIVSCEEAIKLVASVDLVAFGGGPIMAIDELAEIQAIFETARMCGVRTMIAGCGVGPLGDKWHNRAIGSILSLADVRIYRDERSRDLAESLGVETSTDRVAEDPAFVWLETVRKRIPRLEKDPKGLDEVLLLGLRDFPFQSYARHLSEAECVAAKERFDRAVVESLSGLLRRRQNLIIRPLPMCTNHFGGDDRWYYRRLFRGQTAFDGRLDLSLLGGELTPEDYARAFREADAALTMRFHSVVFALALDTPTFVIDYTLGRGKVRALAERFALPCQSLTELDVDVLTDMLEMLLVGERVQVSHFHPRFSSELSEALRDIGLGPGRAAS